MNQSNSKFVNKFNKKRNKFNQKENRYKTFKKEQEIYDIKIKFINAKVNLLRYII